MDGPKMPTLEQCSIPEMSSTATEQQQFTYQDVANLKRVGVKTIMSWVRKGMIPSPIYTGATARFTTDQVADILMGVKPVKSFPVATSPRRKIGAKGGNPNVMPKKKAKKPTTRTATAKKPTTRTATAKKPTTRTATRAKK